MNKIETPYKIVFFDNDGTLNTGRSTWQYLHKHFGTWEPEGRILQEKFLSERTPYDEYSRTVTRLWEGIHRDKFIERLGQIETRGNAVELIKTLKVSGLKIGVLSSGFTLWRDVWRERAGLEFDYYVANEIIFDGDGVCTGEIEIRVTDNVPGMDKGDWVERISDELGILYEERVFVGDGWGDVPGFRKCGLAIAVDPNMSEVNEAADRVLGGDEIMKVVEIISGK